MAVGAEVQRDGGTHFRVWAPRSATVAVELRAASQLDPQAVVPLDAEGNGYFSGSVPEASAGMFYQYRVASGSFPDPASRFQPEGVHGVSQIVDPGDFRWTD